LAGILDWLRKIFFGRTAEENKAATIGRILRGKSRRRLAKKKRKKKLVKIRVRKIPRRVKRLKPKIKKPLIKFSVTRRPRAVQQKPQQKQQPAQLSQATPLMQKAMIAKTSKKPEIHKLPEEITREVIVSDIMVKNVYKVKTDDTLSYVVRLFADKGISGAPVIHDNTFVGIISESDVLKVIGAKDLLSIGGLGLKRLGEIKVEQAMNRNSVTVNEYTSLAQAADLMNKYDVTRLPVLDERRNIVGILTRSDIIRGISKEILFRVLRRRPEEIAKLRLKIETDIDEILRIVERKGLISVEEIQKKLNIPEDKIEEWGKVLEKHDLVEVFYPPIGKPELRKKPK